MGTTLTEPLKPNSEGTVLIPIWVDECGTVKGRAASLSFASFWYFPPAEITDEDDFEETGDK